ncbi:hypothetical protein ACFSJU_14010 [Paradesertivirga mongoliensis]|uniref:Glyoxalase n=1 Tax=Paradesertivirga mongoliensis TaxID=2100740 RepID=A0ABW4ZN45_9SPHI|nr:hypothetical protein [Pedobacter mongoliensis]
MKKAQLYITFNGNTDETFNFYRSVYGGEFMVRLNIPKRLKRESIPRFCKVAYIVLITGQRVFFSTTQNHELDFDTDFQELFHS